jgi:hypothetical protein
MKLYIDTSTAPLAEEDELIERISRLGEDEQSASYSWTGIRNSRGRLRLILEAFSVEQDRRLTELLGDAGLVETPEEGEDDCVFVGDVQRLDQVFGMLLH